MKTLKQEEVDGSAYRDCRHAREAIGDSSNRSIIVSACTPRSTIDRLRSSRQTCRCHVELRAIAEPTLKQPVPELPCLTPGVQFE